MSQTKFSGQFKMISETEQNRVLSDGLPRSFTVGRTVLRHKFNGKLYTLTSLGGQDWGQRGRQYLQIQLKAGDGDTFETSRCFRGEKNWCRIETAKWFESTTLMPTGSDWVI